MNTHFLQPARVQLESREVTATVTLNNQLARTWIAAGTPVVKKDGEANATISETITINAAGPISPGEDAMVAIYPQGRDEAAPKYEALADGVARITTTSATGPYDLTCFDDKVVGVSEGPGRFIHVTMPEGIVQLPALTMGGISYAPGLFTTCFKGQGF